jgi:glycosyltransferase involved in cell wall biosynthesis
VSGPAGRVPASFELTVITITRARAGLLRRALRIVRQQDYAHPIVHLVVVDDDEQRYAALAVETAAAEPVPNRSVAWRFARRRPDDIPGPSVLGRLRNQAVAQARTPLIAFLDDDNLLERHHFSSLLHCMRQTRCTAVHSQRRLLWPDGTPYLAQLSPWKRNIPAARARYRELRRHCVYVPWSNVVRDQVQPRTRPDRIQMVDTSEWLFTREQALATPFGETFTRDDWKNVIGEDNKLLKALIDGDVPVASSHLPTLHYVLGGFSNAFAGEKEDSW